MILKSAHYNSRKTEFSLAFYFYYHDILQNDMCLRNTQSLSFVQCGPFTVALVTDKLLWGFSFFKWSYALLSCNGTRTVLTFITGDFTSCHLLI